MIMIIVNIIEEILKRRAPDLPGLAITKYRVITAIPDPHGLVYHANYLRWFEMGRTELFRHLGLAYKDIEEKGILLPVSEAFCKYIRPAKYDDILVIETCFDQSVPAE